MAWGNNEPIGRHMDHRTNGRVSFSDRPTWRAQDSTGLMAMTGNGISKKTSESELTANHVDINHQTTHNAKKNVCTYKGVDPRRSSSNPGENRQANNQNQKQIAKQTILTRKALKKKYQIFQSLHPSTSPSPPLLTTLQTGSKRQISSSAGMTPG
jgi:hypothetical protein